MKVCMKTWTPYCRCIVSLGNPNWTYIGHAAYIVLALTHGTLRENCNVVSTIEIRDKQESRSLWLVETSNARLVTAAPLIGPQARTVWGIGDCLTLFFQIEPHKVIVVYIIMPLLLCKKKYCVLQSVCASRTSALTNLFYQIRANCYANMLCYTFI